ncbi:MAG: beta-N-acetylhexosaminidase [Candidatus Omnitrophica bacterium]|nr:beta-N-acetylhexosaminidase [Candidatus Omnitrophota bacterium]
MATTPLETLIGARLAVGFHGTAATDELIQQLRQTHAQSLVMFSRNFVSPEQCRTLLRDLEDALGYRLLVMVDHEGGRVVRFTQGVTRFPDALTVGKTHTPEAVEQQGAIEARELRQLRVHVNLAPCVDVVVAGADPIIGDRSYGTDSERVAAFGAARIRGLQTHGVAACAKHFPGLGAVPRDPHKTLPTIPLAWEMMERVHVPPFRSAIEAGVAMVMSSHVCYPALGDPLGLPATFSKRLIQERLRQQLGFTGVIATDDLEMGALRTFGTVGDAAVRATEAGHDLLLICSDLTAASEAMQRLRQAYFNSELNQSELHASVERMTQMRENFLS